MNVKGIPNITSRILHSLKSSLSNVREYNVLGRHLEPVINPKSCENIPIHRWYYLKESYTPFLIEKLIQYNILNKPKQKLLDPFCGAGSSLLGAQWLGINSVGVDINPFFVFVTSVKLEWHRYSVEKIKKFYRYIKSIDLKNKKPSLEIPRLSSFKRLFKNSAIRELLLLKEEILKLDDELHKKLFLLALASIIEPSSLAKKDGKGLKIVRDNPIDTPKNLFLKKLEKIILDLNHIKHGFFNIKTANATAIVDDSRVLNNIDDESIDAIVFSPPYLNSFDYTEVYKLELWFLDFVKNYDEFKKLRERTLRSHNLVRWGYTNYWDNEELSLIVERIKNMDLWSDIIPIMIRGYFDDLYLTFKQFYRIMSHGRVVIVVGNSAYGGIIIPVDMLLLKMAKDLGFTPKLLIPVRLLGTSSQQMKIIKQRKLRSLLRESIIVFEKDDNA